MTDTILCSIQTEYIDYLRSFSRLKQVYDNKDGISVHSRKYLGIVLTVGSYQYYVPLSSPKEGDYLQTPEGVVIRKSIIPIIRILSDGTAGQQELKGTLRISNMIPVPSRAIIPYIIADETTRTNLPGVFAVGDIRTKALRQIITAAADGAMASKFAEEYLNTL